MKKFILFILLVGFTCISANAEQIFFTAGRPTHAMNGHGRVRSINNFGSNSAFLPHNRIRAGQRIRMQQRQDAINRALESMGQRHPSGGKTIASDRETPSRFNKNYTIPTRRSYTKNGITYYN